MAGTLTWSQSAKPLNTMTAMKLFYLVEAWHPKSTHSLTSHAPTTWGEKITTHNNHKTTSYNHHNNNNNNNNSNNKPPLEQNKPPTSPKTHKKNYTCIPSLHIQIHQQICHKSNFGRVSNGLKNRLTKFLLDHLIKKLQMTTFMICVSTTSKPSGHVVFR